MKLLALTFSSIQELIAHQRLANKLVLTNRSQPEMRKTLSINNCQHRTLRTHGLDKTVFRFVLAWESKFCLPIAICRGKDSSYRLKKRKRCSSFPMEFWCLRTHLYRGSSFLLVITTDVHCRAVHYILKTSAVKWCKLWLWLTVHWRKSTSGKAMRLMFHQILFSSIYEFRDSSLKDIIIEHHSLFMCILLPHY